MGVVNLIEPPHRDNIKQVRIITDGTEIIIVVVWKNTLIPCPIPVKNIWCAQTKKDIKPRKVAEYTRDLYPQIGLRVLFAITSARIPIPGRINT